METIYTIQGDTWDTIAKRVYGDERKAQVLMETRKNVALLDIQVFPAGIAVTVPAVTVDATADNLPEWRK